LWAERAHRTVASNKSPAMDDKKQEEKDARKVSFTGLFRYTDGTDVLLMLVGTVAAMANGVSQPLMTLIMGQVINAFGEATNDNVLSRVNEVSPQMPHSVSCRCPGLSLANTARITVHGAHTARLDFWCHFRSLFPFSTSLLFRLTQSPLESILLMNLNNSLPHFSFFLIIFIVPFWIVT
jgi:hypothetical protein